MSDKTNTIAQNVAEKPINNMEFKANSTKVYGKSPLAQYTHKDDTLSERHKDLLERFPSKDISDIRKLERTLNTFDSSDIDMEEISELCLENDIVSPEILLLDVMFKNDLKTASRNGITVLNIDDSLEIRNDGEKFLSPQEADLIRAYIVGEDDNVPPGFQARVDAAIDSEYNFGSIKTKTAQGFQGKLKNVEMNYSPSEEVTMEGEYVVSH